MAFGVFRNGHHERRKGRRRRHSGRRTHCSARRRTKHSTHRGHRSRRDWLDIHGEVAVAFEALAICHDHRYKVGSSRSVIVPQHEIGTCERQTTWPGSVTVVNRSRPGVRVRVRKTTVPTELARSHDGVTTRIDDGGMIKDRDSEGYRGKPVRRLSHDSKHRSLLNIGSLPGKESGTRADQRTRCDNGRQRIRDEPRVESLYLNRNDGTLFSVLSGDGRDHRSKKSPAFEVVKGESSAAAQGHGESLPQSATCVNDIARLPFENRAMSNSVARKRRAGVTGGGFEPPCSRL